jgi:hypothetical protein
MTSRRWVLFASIVTAPLAVAGSAVSGCASSNSATPAEAGVEASVISDAGPAEAAADGATHTVQLQWSVRPLHLQAGVAGSGDAGDAAVAPEAGATEAGVDDAAGGADGAGDGSAEAGDGGRPMLEGVKVCVYQNSAIPCVTSGANGEFILPGLPVRTNIAVTLEKTGYTSDLLAIATASIDMDGRANPIFMYASDSPTPPIGVPIDWVNKGQVSMFALGQTPDGGNGFAGDPGATLTLAPMSGNGPYFLDSHTNFVLGATSFVNNLAWYYNLTPGTYTLTYNDTRNDCEPISFQFGGWGYPVTTPAHSLQFPIVAGYITGIVGEICTPNSIIVKTDGG